jgi:hypothetical protein
MGTMTQWEPDEGTWWVGVAEGKNLEVIEALATQIGKIKKSNTIYKLKAISMYQALLRVS